MFTISVLQTFGGMPLNMKRPQSIGFRTARWALLVLVLGSLRSEEGSGQLQPVRSPRGMVVAESRLAAEAGAEVLRGGGNAVDAAVATAFALAVTHPAAGNLGGGGFLIYRDYAGDAVAYDFRETAPARAHPEMFLEAGGYNATRHHHSHLAVGVPGTVAGLHLAWRDHGRTPWKALVQPAITLAAEGFVVSTNLADSLSGALSKFKSSPAALGQFSHSGRPYLPGELLRQPDLARTLQLVADRGPAGFYEGSIADAIEGEMRMGGGWITKADLAAYRARRRDPVRGTYRGFEVLSMPPPSSGGIVLVLMLNILEGFDLAEVGPGSTTAVHLMAEAMRRGFALRARELGDPDFNPGLSQEEFVSKDYARRLRRTIRLNRASESAPDRFEWPAEGSETTHLSVVDTELNAVALTTTLEESYGSGIVAPGTGFLLNNEMGDFNAGPGLTTTNGLIGTAPNLAGPARRMLSSMTPTILVKDSRAFLVVGSPGGRTIINTVLEVIVNLIDHRMTLVEALKAPRFHHQWLPDRIDSEPNAFSSETRAGLHELGHILGQHSSTQGAVMAIRYDSAQHQLEGAADPRAPDAAALLP